MSDAAPDTPTSTRNTRSKKVPFASLLDDGPEDFADYDWTDDTFAAYTRTTLDKNGDDVIVTFKLGDVVLARSNDGNRPSLAVISKLMDVMERKESVMRAELRWFRYADGQKEGSLENEVYYILDPFDFPSQLSDILHPAEVMGLQKFQSLGNIKGRTYNALVNRKKHVTVPTVYMCRLAVDTMREAFYQFDWEHFHSNALAGNGWIVERGDAVDLRNKTKAKMQKAKTIERKSVAKTKKQENERPKGTSSKKQTAENYPLLTTKAKTPKPKQQADNLFTTPTKSKVKTSINKQVNYDSDNAASTSSGSTHSRYTVSEAEDTEPSDSSGPELPSSDEELRPRKRRLVTSSRIVIAPTPQSRKSLKARTKGRIGPRLRLPDLDATLASLPENQSTNVTSLARVLLHVGATPDFLPCREEEFAEIEAGVEDLLEEGRGGCVYISGVPGTGKTATVHGVMRSLQNKAQKHEINPFTFVEINGLKVQTPAHAYSLLWSGIENSADNDYEISPKQALANLERTFSRPGPSRKSCVVLMDELDQLVSAKQSEIYNFFNWPTLPGSRLIVLAVANTMDMPEKVFKGKVASRLGMTRINFHPYDRNQLVEIVKSRLRLAIVTAKKADGIRPSASDLEQADTTSLFTSDAITIAAGGVAAVSGDARRVLDIVRRALESACIGDTLAAPVQVKDIQEIVKKLRANPNSVALRGTPLFGQIMLVAAMRAAVRAGLGNGVSSWEETRNHFFTIFRQIDCRLTAPNLSDLASVLSNLISSRLLNAEERAGREGDKGRLVWLLVPEIDLRRELGEIQSLARFLVD